jgi:hypothetical protein
MSKKNTNDTNIKNCKYYGKTGYSTRTLSCFFYFWHFLQYNSLTEKVLKKKLNVKTTIKKENKSLKHKRRFTLFDSSKTVTLEFKSLLRKPFSQFWPSLRHILSKKTYKGNPRWFFCTRK